MSDTDKESNARKKYVELLQWALDKGHWAIPDMSYTVINPDLLKKEIETQEHFRQNKFDVITISPEDESSSDIDDYSFGDVDWEEIGVERTGFKWPKTQPNTSHGSIIPDFLDGLEGAEDI
jgi:hypothetical protein